MDGEQVAAPAGPPQELVAWRELVAWERQRAKLLVLIERARRSPAAGRVELDLLRIERSVRALDRELGAPSPPAEPRRARGRLGDPHRAHV